MNNSRYIDQRNANKKDFEEDINKVKEYTKLVSYHFRKFKVNCESCVSKTEKEFHYIYNDLWYLIHSLCFKLKTDISKNVALKRGIENFYCKFKLLPCEICRKHYKEYLRDNPLRNVKNNFDLQNWTIDLHNSVNRRLNKPVFFFSSAKMKYS